ncbi:septal ring lytic transglycosylase RlpA family protein [Pedobacter sp. SD-b]|uniref:Probable endolytic peptidoglycan transglycosylase RlpA n=1 Tax=Pedobacter segetis TaxID=2793069 RepID=A0ABS1BHS4_9SPHI|nr:septal ring lytic transglycosylase RlpA family protein [Pedobacter segetis]MBK0381911.1 septal ring lytic transglycosylase RlpA family protein [Pedobacter segetis]
MKLIISCLFFISTLFASEIVTKTGRATYYANRFNGRRTTSGQIYKHDKFTAAHKTLPFGTQVKVTNLDNGKSVTVIINDRGPYGKNMLIDLSQSAAKEIGLYGKGVVNCEIEYELQ